ncbi:MAG: hypothetical protein C4521_08440 [Actinobacteria bacterium]|nr:MAG: hypothetical protein C4521_08440 [Actinomycetota bacterium]
MAFSEPHRHSLVGKEYTQGEERRQSILLAAAGNGRGYLSLATTKTGAYRALFFELNGAFFRSRAKQA